MAVVICSARAIDACSRFCQRGSHKSQMALRWRWMNVIAVHPLGNTRACKFPFMIISVVAVARAYLTSTVATRRDTFMLERCSAKTSVNHRYAVVHHQLRTAMNHQRFLRVSLLGLVERRSDGLAMRRADRSCYYLAGPHLSAAPDSFRCQHMTAACWKYLVTPRCTFQTRCPSTQQYLNRSHGPPDICFPADWDDLRIMPQ